MRKESAKQINITFRKTSREIGQLRKSIKQGVDLEKAKTIQHVLRNLISDLKEADWVFQDYIISELAAAGSIKIENIVASNDGRIPDHVIISAIENLTRSIASENAEKHPDCVETLRTSEAQQSVSVCS